MDATAISRVFYERVLALAWSQKSNPRMTIVKFNVFALQNVQQWTIFILLLSVHVDGKIKPNKTPQNIFQTCLRVQVHRSENQECMVQQSFKRKIIPKDSVK